MDIEDKDIFDSALSDEPIEQVTADETVTEQPVVDGQPRDEHGRFAPKEPEPVAEAKPDGKEEAYVPSWRLREMREEREAVERRFQETQAQWQRQIAELQARLPKDEPKPAPDMFEDPNRFLEHGVQKAVDPINSKIASVVETISRKWAVKEHGQEKVDAAYKWVAEGMQTRNPEVMAVYQRAMASDDPFEHIVEGHQKQSVFQQIGKDPGAWFEKELDRRFSDPQYQAALMQRIQSGVRAQGTQTPNQIKLPPSIGKVPSSHSASDDAGDMSDGSLFAHAMR